jgi:hypothetical protein
MTAACSFSQSSSISLVLGVPFAQFWSIFVQFWSIFGLHGELQILEMRFCALFSFSSAGRRASVTLDVLNTVRAIRVRQAHDATWEHCLSVP